MKSETIGASAVAGLATGPRSFTGLAAVVLATPPGSRAQPDRVLAHPATKTAIGLLALQEWVLDKLPKTPSRLEALGLATRSLGAAASGGILARRAQVAAAANETIAVDPTIDGHAPSQPVAPDWIAIGACAATSAGVALGVAVFGVHLRSWFENVFGGRDWPAAALEDASSAALAAAAVFVSTSR